MKAPMLLDKLCAQLQEADCGSWVPSVRALYHTTYKEAYAAGQDDCEEQWSERTTDEREETPDDERGE